MPRTYTTPAIILKRFNYSEADRILTLLTPEYGKIIAIAKGVRKPSSRKRGHVELFTHVKAALVNGKTWEILTEVETIDDFISWRHDLQRVSYAYHLAELVDRLIPEQQPHTEVFQWLINAYCYLQQDQPDWSQLHRGFKYRLIQELGYWPHQDYPPADVDAFLESILERPMYTNKFLQQVAGQE